uniref:Reticulon domain-containing protein n=4 Tax=Aegilops tauschii subsp. strangulata TaxID=200361 RepID=A0A453N5P3_AEGTS
MGRLGRALFCGSSVCMNNSNSVEDLNLDIHLFFGHLELLANKHHFAIVTEFDEKLCVSSITPNDTNSNNNFFSTETFKILENIKVPVDPLEWQISQEMANSIVASLANTIGAAESVLRVAATGHDKKLLFKVVLTLYFLAALGRVVSGAAIAYAALCIFSLYMFAQSTDQFDQLPWVPLGRDSLGGAQDTT